MRRYISTPSLVGPPYVFRVQPSTSDTGQLLFEAGTRVALVEAAYVWSRDHFGPPIEKDWQSDREGTVGKLVESRGRWFYDEGSDMMYFNQIEDAIEFRLRWT